MGWFSTFSERRRVVCAGLVGWAFASRCPCGFRRRLEPLFGAQFVNGDAFGGSTFTQYLVHDLDVVGGCGNDGEGIVHAAQVQLAHRAGVALLDQETT
jgi:hypothetical protein